MIEKKKKKLLACDAIECSNFKYASSFIDILEEIQTEEMQCARKPSEKERQKVKKNRYEKKIKVNQNFL